MTRPKKTAGHLDTPLDFRDLDGFLVWLSANHDRVSSVDLFLYKKGHRDKGISYEDAVRAALCWGWIDSVTHRHDEVRFRQRFTPRKPGSNWSASNIRRVMVLLDEGRMTPAGLALFDMDLIDRLPQVEEAERARRESPTELPDFARDRVEAGTGILPLWEALPPSHQRNYIRWIMDAKREDTRVRRVRKMISMLAEGRSQSEL